MYKTPTIGLDNPYVTIKVEYFKFLYDRFKNELLFVKDRIMKYYNVKRMKRSFFEEENKVYLLRKNITTKRPNNKLNFKKLGPFIIVRNISELNYKLSLSKTM